MYFLVNSHIITVHFQFLTMISGFLQFEPTTIRAYVHKGTALIGVGDVSQVEFKCFMYCYNV